VTDEDGTSVYAHRPGETKYAGSYETWQVAREVAERIARERGVDGYSFFGLWRSLAPTKDQLEALRRWNVPVSPKLTRGKAFDLLSLAVVESIKL